MLGKHRECWLRQRVREAASNQENWEKSISKICFPENPENPQTPETLFWYFLSQLKGLEPLTKYNGYAQKSAVEKVQSYLITHFEEAVKSNLSFYKWLKKTGLPRDWYLYRNWSTAKLPISALSLVNHQQKYWQGHLWYLVSSSSSELSHQLVYSCNHLKCFKTTFIIGGMSVFEGQQANQTYERQEGKD